VYLGIEIGGTKLQLGVGADDGKLAALWRGSVDVAAGPEGIRRQITAAVPELLQRAGLDRSQVRGVGIGFGGPVDDATRTIIKSHQIDGWNNFPLAEWITEITGLLAVLGNDADVAGLAEALHGAGKGLSPIFYITIGSGIGGGFIIDGEIYRGVGRGAAEIGHLRIASCLRGRKSEIRILEQWSSGWWMAKNYLAEFLYCDPMPAVLDSPITAQSLVRAAEGGDKTAQEVLSCARIALAAGICHVIALLCPRRIIVGGGVSLMGERLLFAPLRELVAERVFEPFAGLTDIVPAALGEEVVVHGAIALARKRLGITRGPES
jgi:glucokinase